MSSQRLLSCCLAVILGVAVSSCRTGGDKTAKAPTGPESPAFVQALVGQQRILLSGGESRAVARKAGQAAPKPDACDAAVEIQQASLQGGTLRFSVRSLGQPRLEGVAPRRGKPCAVAAQTAVTVSGLADGADAAAVEQELERVLQTPDAYLTAAGINVARPSEVVEGIAATGVGTSSAPERNLARQVTTWPKRLLWVDVAAPAPKKGLRREVEVEVAGVVAADGRFTEPKVNTRLADEHAEAVKRSLGLWRFDPARAGEKAIAARTASRCALRMY
jgi:hypothetical protein